MDEEFQQSDNATAMFYPTKNVHKIILQSHYQMLTFTLYHKCKFVTSLDAFRLC